MTDALKTWIYATRPHTLGASVAPMLIVLGATISERVFNLGLYLLCFIVAISAQIASNFANDYFDYKGGKDTENRIGFERLLTSGRVTIQEMKIALLIAIGVCASAGITLAALQGWELLIIGALVLIASIAYSAGPIPLSHHGLGDIAVVLFYGVIPITASYYAIGGIFPTYLIPLAFGIGIWEANILVTNNYRDHDEDSNSGKKTIIVRMGKSSGPLLYLINSALSILCLITGVLMSGRTVGAIIVGIGSAVFYTIGILSINKLSLKSLNKLLKYTNMISLLMGIMLLITLLFHP